MRSRIGTGTTNSVKIFSNSSYSDIVYDKYNTQYSSSTNLSYSTGSYAVHNKYTVDELTIPVTPDEFLKAVPRYPNDGVLLIDVDKYNAHNILADIDALAAANGRGEYAVGTYVRVCE